MKQQSLFALLTTFALSSTAMAGGYQLQEYSVVNLGRAFGGAGIIGDDYSAIAFNPAGMTLKGSGLQIGNSTVRIRSSGTGTLSTGAAGKGHIKALANLPHFFAQKKVSDNLTLGTGVYVPFGLGTYYRKKDWFASNHAVNSEISAVDGSLAASYKLSENWSVGASFIMEYLDARLTNDLYYNGRTIGASDMKADGWKPGYSFGVMYQPSKDTRFGISYRSKIVHKIKGPHYLYVQNRTFHGDCGTKLTLPEHILISGYHKIGKFGLSAMARWTRWSHFDTLNITSDSYLQRAGTSQTPAVNEDWKNVWMFGGGVDYDLTPHWTLRGGVAWDQGAVKREETRTARVPDTNRILTTLGASYKTGNWQWDFAYGHMFWKNARVNNQLASDGTTLNAKYRTKIDLVALGLQYNF